MRTQADKKANTGDVLAAAPDRVTMSSDLLQLLYPNLLYRRLPDLIGHPGRSVLWLLDLSSVALIPNLPKSSGAQVKRLKYFPLFFCHFGD